MNRNIAYAIAAAIAVIIAGAALLLVDVSATSNSSNSTAPNGTAVNMSAVNITIVPSPTPPPAPLNATKLSALLDAERVLNANLSAQVQNLTARVAYLSDIAAEPLAAIARADARELILESREAEAAALAAGAHNITESHPLVSGLRTKLNAVYSVVGPLNGYAQVCADRANRLHDILAAYDRPTSVWPVVVVGNHTPTDANVQYIDGHGGITYIKNFTHTTVLKDGVVIAQACQLYDGC